MFFVNIPFCILKHCGFHYNKPWLCCVKKLGMSCPCLIAFLCVCVFDLDKFPSCPFFPLNIPGHWLNVLSPNLVLLLSSCVLGLLQQMSSFYTFTRGLVPGLCASQPDPLSMLISQLVWPPMSAVLAARRSSVAASRGHDSFLFSVRISQGVIELSDGCGTCCRFNNMLFLMAVICHNGAVSKCRGGEQC